jgi:hypothetical protein
MYSRDLNIASCSAWLLMHFPSSLYFRLLVCVPDMYIAIHAPIPCSVLLPSVNICILLLSFLMSVLKLMDTEGCSQYLIDKCLFLASVVFFQVDVSSSD